MWTFAARSRRATFSVLSRCLDGEAMSLVSEELNVQI